MYLSNLSWIRFRLYLGTLLANDSNSAVQASGGCTCTLWEEDHWCRSAGESKNGELHPEAQSGRTAQRSDAKGGGKAAVFQNGARYLQWRTSSTCGWAPRWAEGLWIVPIAHPLGLVNLETKHALICDQACEDTAHPEVMCHLHLTFLSLNFCTPTGWGWNLSGWS